MATRRTAARHTTAKKPSSGLAKWLLPALAVGVGAYLLWPKKAHAAPEAIPPFVPGVRPVGPAPAPAPLPAPAPTPDNGGGFSGGEITPSDLGGLAAEGQAGGGNNGLLGNLFGTGTAGLARRPAPRNPNMYRRAAG